MKIIVMINLLDRNFENHFVFSGCGCYDSQANHWYDEI
jgi:hypothetical protein